VKDNCLHTVTSSSGEDQVLWRILFITFKLPVYLNWPVSMTGNHFFFTISALMHCLRLLAVKLMSSFLKHQELLSFTQFSSWQRKIFWQVPPFWHKLMQATVAFLLDTLVFSSRRQTFTNATNLYHLFTLVLICLCRNKTSVNKWYRLAVFVKVYCVDRKTKISSTHNRMHNIKKKVFVLFKWPVCCLMISKQCIMHC
jgi:hypothetical protein